MIKKYQRTQNLISMEMLSNDTNMDAGGVMYPYNGRVGTDTDIDVSSLNNVTVSVDLVGKSATLYFIYAIFNGTTLIDRVAGNLTGTSINTTNATILRLCFYINNDSIDKTNLANLMVNEGSTAKPYQPYYDWITIPYRKFTTATEAVENPLYSDGTAITAYTLKGNEEHTGTPTPSNPVYVNGVGVRTENLWNDTLEQGSLDTTTGQPVSADTRVRSKNGIQLSSGTYTISTDSDKSIVSRLYNLDGTYIGSGGVLDNPLTFTLESNLLVKFIIHYKNNNNISPSDVSQIMLNSGSTAKPYEPYGYKIPISSGGVTTNLYLGSTQTVRQIKKVVFDGSEDWQGIDDTANKYLGGVWDYKAESGVTCMSTHYSGANNVVSGDPIPNNSACFFNSNYPKYLYLKGSEPITLADFKAYLAAQYAAGTPVTVWYVLETPQTAAVNEPLMKIGTYVDTLSNAAQIPTTEGANSITVDTTVQPSEFTATWTGWHDASVKEKSENLFDYQTMAVSDENSYLNSDGTIGTSTDWNISDYIPCDGTSFTVGDIGGNTPAICLYNANKEYITGKSYNTGGTYSKQAVNITSQTTAKFIRFSYCKGSLNPDDLSAIMLNSGSTALPYEPYWK